MALKNITNTKIDSLFKQPKKAKQTDNNQIFIEQLACSPSRLKYNKHPQPLPKMDQFPPKSGYVRTSSPIGSPIKQHQRSNNYNPAAITSVPSLNGHPEQRLSKRPPLPTLRKATSQTSSHNSHFSSKNASGMLKVALYNNHGLLTVHIIQSRNLRHIQGNELRCDSYVRVTMLPDPEQRLKCQTRSSKTPPTRYSTRNSHSNSPKTTTAAASRSVCGTAARLSSTVAAMCWSVASRSR